MSVSRHGIKGELARLALANERPLAEARALLVLASLLMVLFEPVGPFRMGLVVLLFAYGTYSLLLLWQLKRGTLGGHARVAYWVDLLCYGVVILLSGGLTSPFGIFLLFPVLLASYQDGMRRGFAVAACCTFLYATICGIQFWGSGGEGWQEYSFTSVSLLLFVPVIVARWGQAERTIMRRLAFANDLTRTFTPRNGLDQALTHLAELLRDYQGADGCAIIINDQTKNSWFMYEADLRGIKGPLKGRRIPNELAGSLVKVGGTDALVYAPARLLQRQSHSAAYDCATLQPKPIDTAILQGLADALETESFISLPMQVRRQVIGRFHLTSRQGNFTRDDIAFLAQVMSQTEVMIENLQLVERLVFEVASEERKRISRDLHDSTVQPYIGLKLGLEALKRRLTPDNPAGHDVDDLLRMANDGIVQLRHYVGTLNNKTATAQPISLVPAVRLQANKFSEFYGIDARVVAHEDVLVEGHVFEELMHIVREALSNIRRHTAADHATITLSTKDDELTLEFANDNGGERPGPDQFFPRSIGERAKELGGRVNIEKRDGGQTAVTICVPL